MKLDSAGSVKAKASLAEDVDVPELRGAVAARRRGVDVAVLLPCYNEGLVIRSVIERFHAVLPQARIYVYDNNSTDNSVAEARAAGAIVRSERRQGKGFVVRRMFTDIDADVYLMCDADGTYDAEVAGELVDDLVENGLDMVVGTRVDTHGGAYRPAHKFGNWLLTTLVQKMFGKGFSDMLSGYRVFSRRFVKSFPSMARGFEIETELTIHSLQLEMPVKEVATHFENRIEGSESKLSTIRDGIRILMTIGTLVRQERPLMLFGLASAFLALVSLALGYPVVVGFMETGLVRVPTALLATGIAILAFLSLFSGLILDTVTRGCKEAKRLRYLEFSGLHAIMETREETD